VQEQIQAEAIPSTIQNFNAERYANLSLPRPPLEVQRSVAVFLDAQVALLDRAIHLRRRQVALLQSRLQSLVGAVGDGSDPRLSGAPCMRAGLVLTVLPGFAFPSVEFDDIRGTLLLRGIKWAWARHRGASAGAEVDAGAEVKVEIAAEAVEELDLGVRTLH